MSTNSKRRVKVYKLNAEGSWDDSGTGYVDIKWLGDSTTGGMHLVVTGEEDESITLLSSRLSEDDIYQRQQDTLIVWSEPDSEGDEVVDLALSFAEAVSCSEVWDIIYQIQRKAGVQRSSFMDQDIDEDEYLDEAPPMEMPPPQMKHLDQLVALFTEHYGPFQKERLAAGLLRDNYIRKLLDVFHMAEDLDSQDSLHKLFTIFKSVVMLNNPAVLEVIFRPEYIIDVLGALEYDPDLARKCNHREFLQRQVEFKTVVPLRQELLDVIHLTFRMQYMKDVVLPRVLDEATFATLNSLIFFNNVKIINDLRKDDHFLNQLFTILKTPQSHDQLRDALRFLREMCELGKTLEPKSKGLLYLTLEKFGMFDVIEKNFVDKEVKLRLICAELSLFSVENEARQLRRHILSQKARKHSFLHQLIHVLHTDEEIGVKNIVTDVLRTLLEAEPQEPQSPERDLMTVFYQDFFRLLMDPLMQPLPASGTHTEAATVLKNNLLDLLGFFVHHHGYRIKYEILKSGFLNKTLELLKTRDKHLVLATLRFFRALIGTSDKFYCKHIVKENLFEPIIQVFLQHEGRYNLINSAVLELFAFIKKENIKQLVAYFVQSFYDRVKHIKYVDLFEQLKAKHEQNDSLAGEASSTHSGVGTPTRGSRGSYGPSRIISDEQERFSRHASEDSYFDDEDDDDLPSSGNGPSSENSPPSRGSGALSSAFPGLDQDDDMFRFGGASASRHSSGPEEVDAAVEFGAASGSAAGGTTAPLVPYDGLEDALAEPDDKTEDGELRSKKRKSVDMGLTEHNAEPPSPKRLKDSAESSGVPVPLQSSATQPEILASLDAQLSV